MAEGKNSSVSRRAFFGLAAGCMVAAFTKPAKADLFGGDITVLLAQLQQQLTLVSNAIATVQRVTESAQRLSSMVDHAKQLGAMVTGRGGLTGFLSGLKGIVDGARGATTNLQTLNVRGGYWKDRIEFKVKTGQTALPLKDLVRLSKETNELDRAFLRDVSKITGSFARTMNSFEALEAAAEAVNEAQGVTGVVGQTQLLGREVLQLTGIAAEIHAANSAMGAMQADELARQAAARELEREKQEAYRRQVYGEYGRPQEAEPVDVKLTQD